uniref:Uncharacterized protein n=1 Tax=Aegilops tauschii subsp. strangulata TaxID=200361 RepID=A0A453FH73_AEGTS
MLLHSHEWFENYLLISHPNCFFTSRINMLMEGEGINFGDNARTTLSWSHMFFSVVTYPKIVLAPLLEV